MLGWSLILSGILGAAERIPPPEMAARHEDLRAEIGRLDDAYFRRADPMTSDRVYDGLKRELAVLERTYPVLAAGHPADGFGDDRSGLFRTARHRVPMLGLDKVYTEAELRAFVAAAQAGPEGFVIEPKVDGVALSLTYERGRLVRAVTRGDGAEGDDVTDLVRGLPGLPQELAKAAPVPALVEVRGEWHVPVAVFARVNRERAAAGERGFAHPRSAAAGALRQTDPREVAQRGLAFVVHGFGAWEPTSTVPATQREFLERVRRWSLPALEGVRQAVDANGVWRAVEAMGRERARVGLPMDGVVVKVDAVARQRALGGSAVGPRWAVAFKFTSPRAETRLLAIEVQVGRTGLLTPVAVLEPVELAGSVVTRATLYNADEIVRLDARIGDTVVVEKAGEVIPVVGEVVVAARPGGTVPFVFPTRCPVCGAPAEHRDGEVARRCPNEDCPAQLAGRIGHVAAREVLDLPGLGPALIESLIARGRLRTIADIFRLQPADLVLPGRVPGAAAENLARAITAARGAELHRWILALSIPGVGESAAARLAAQFQGLGELANADAAALRGAGRGEATTRAVMGYFASPRHRALLGELRAVSGR